MEKERPKEVAKRKEVTMARTTQERPLAGKVALVAGGSRAIGAVFAKRLVAPNFDQPLSYWRLTTSPEGEPRKRGSFTPTT